ncbi:MAG: hypothetical protein ACR2ML_09050 [Solirubrobacteraceae bacterium]
MRTLYSATMLHQDGATTIVDYLDELGWRRHGFDAGGGYVAVTSSGARALEPLRDDGPLALVHELRKAAEALTTALQDYELEAAATLAEGFASNPDIDLPMAVGSPPGEAPDSLRRDRRELLEWLVTASGDAWSDGIRRLGRSSAGDPQEAARVSRAIAVLRASREHALRELAEDRYRPA